jgi:hypothetical protein
MEKRTTPFAAWRERGEEDPHGELYDDSTTMKLCNGHMNHQTVAYALLTPNIVYLTAGKERLRWLSRQAYKLCGDHDEMNERRYRMLRGDLTDDELANQFYLSEERTDLIAGKQRIEWLTALIEEAELNLT